MSVLDAWHHKVHEIPRGGLQQRREAGKELLSAVALELEVLECHKLVADYRIRDAGSGRYELKGSVHAEFTRTCVVSLEPLREVVSETLDCMFVPTEMLRRSQTEEEEALAVEEVEPIVNDTIEVGRVVYEVLAANLDPYPRAAGAAYEPASQEAGQSQSSEHPLAGLAKLKGKGDDAL